jgi:hypothetical protein
MKDFTNGARNLDGLDQSDENGELDETSGRLCCTSYIAGLLVRGKFYREQHDYSTGALSGTENAELVRLRSASPIVNDVKSHCNSPSR